MISPERLRFCLSWVTESLFLPDGLSNDLADVDDHQFVGDGVGVSGVVLVHSVGHNHPDELRAAKQVLD